MFAAGRFIRLVGLCALVLCAACEKDSGDRLAEIRELQSKGRFAETVDRLRTMVDEDPDSAELNFLLGQALFRTGEVGLAVWPLRRAAESPDYVVNASLLLAEITLQTREGGDASELLNQVIELAPENVNAHLLRAWSHLRKGRHEEALEDLARVEELAPKNLERIVPQAMALISLKRLDEAEALLEGAEQDLESVEGQARQTLASGLCAGAAALDYERGEMEAAEAGFNACVEKYPTEPILVDGSIEFFDAMQKRERGTEILRAAFDLEPSRFRGALIARMQSLGDTEEVERLTREWTELEPSPQSWFALGSFYTQREQYQAAKEAFEEALALARGEISPMLRFAYGDTLIQLSEFEQAEQVAQAMGDTLYADLLRGRLRLAQGDPRAALEALDKGIRLWPNNSAARFYAGQAAEGIGDFERAISEYRESIRSDVRHTNAALDLATLHEAMGNNAQALEIIGRYVRSHPDDPEGYAVTVRVAGRVARHDVAAEGLRRLAMLPGQAGRAVAIEAELVAGSRGEEAAANLIERSGLDLTDPANAAALRTLVGSLGNLGRRDEALRRVEAALEAHPDAAVLHVLRGEVLRDAGRPAAEVGAALERAIELDPDRPEALAALARLRGEAGQIDAALGLYARAASADPSEPAYLEAAVRLLRAADRSKQADERLEEMIVRYPREPQPAIDLAAELVRRRTDLDRAVALAKRAVLFQGGAEALEVLGNAQLERGDAVEAVKAFQNALKLDPGSSSVRYRLGLGLARSGDVEGARDAFRQVLESAAAPEAEQARAELARLEQL